MEMRVRLGLDVGGVLHEAPLLVGLLEPQENLMQQGLNCVGDGVGDVLDETGGHSDADFFEDLLVEHVPVADLFDEAVAGWIVMEGY